MWTLKHQHRVAVAHATVDELPVTRRGTVDAERAAAGIAAQRAIRLIAGDHAAVEIRRRPGRAPIAYCRQGDEPRRRIVLSLTHRNGRAAAAAAAAGSMIGIDLEMLEAVHPSRERFFLTESERRATSRVGAAVLWSMKEAVWKAMELRPDIGFHELELLMDDGRVFGAECRGLRCATSVTIETPWPGYVLTTAQLQCDRSCDR